MLALVLASGCGAKQAVTAARTPSLQVRLVADEPSGSSESFTFTNGQEVVHLQGAVLLDETAVTATWIWQRGSTVGIDLTLTGPGKVRLAERTRENIGKRVGIIIDGRLRSVAEITGEVSSGMLTVTSDWTLEEVDKLAREFDSTGTERSRAR